MRGLCAKTHFEKKDPKIQDWKNNSGSIQKLRTTFPSEVLIALGKRSYGNLTFDNVLARRGSSFC